MNDEVDNAVVAALNDEDNAAAALDDDQDNAAAASNDEGDPAAALNADDDDAFIESDQQEQHLNTPIQHNTIYPSFHSTAWKNYILFNKNQK